ncbi:hypothetical protein TNCV_4910171 [Trichonephila clavipes]|nr:hypothetical protein TNCV_4910171 [Trichonephila clavipes]
MVLLFEIAPTTIDEKQQYLKGNWKPNLISSGIRDVRRDSPTPREWRDRPLGSLEKRRCVLTFSITKKVYYRIKTLVRESNLSLGHLDMSEEGKKH